MSKKEKENKSQEMNPATKEKKKVLRQTDLPKVSLEEAIQVPEAIWSQFAGSSTQPIFVAQAVGISPSSSNWRLLCGAAIAYGLTEGGYNSKSISLTDLGKKVVAPTEENEDIYAKKEAAQLPLFFKMFYEKYGNGNKLPQDKVAENLLVSWGVPQADSKEAYSLIKRNGEYSGIIVSIKGNQYVNTATNQMLAGNDANDEAETGNIMLNEENSELPDSLLQKMNISAPKSNECYCPSQNNKVFISHGKNRVIVDQLKQLLEFGAFEPVVSVERETTAIPVPEKVFNDMRMCSAGLIHIDGERKCIDSEGVEHNLINENVLIEIGAAIALFNSKVILLCKKGINLPSNLQGLYRCEYDGEQLDYQATIKLLKTFSEFRKTL